MFSIMIGMVAWMALFVLVSILCAAVAIAAVVAAGYAVWAVILSAIGRG